MFSHILSIKERAIDQFNWTKEERLAYDQSKKRKDDYHSSLFEKFNEGKKEGIQIGEEKGEMKAKIGLAKNLLKAGVSADLIAESTGL